MLKLLSELKKSSFALANSDEKTRNSLIEKIAFFISRDKDKILRANALDLELGANLNSALRDRLSLNETRINELCESLNEIAALSEVLGVVERGWKAKSGIKIEKISIPLGTICVIYESRPNITAQIAALCIKSGNCCALKGGKEARNTNLAIMDAINLAFDELNSPRFALYLEVDRDDIKNLIKMSEYFDLIVPRGGSSLVEFVSTNASVPVLKHDKGICHVFVDKNADLQKALNICINAKCSRPGVCNAAETFLIHEQIAKEFLPILASALSEFKVEIFGCKKTAAIIPCKCANDANYASEYLDFKLNIKIVRDENEALEHIAKFSSGHSECVVSENYDVCEYFLARVNSACVYANASTRFSDGGEFGFGAELGISTNKLHARGPVGLKELTTYKYIIRGNGQIR